MAANASGVAGALYDTNATNKLGGLTTGIGWGANAIYGPPLTPGMDAGDAVGVAVIGSAPPYTAAEACGYAGYPAKLVVATSTVAPGGALPDGSTNASGRTALAGSGVFGILQSDADVDDWMARVASNSGSVSASTKDAVKAFAMSAKAAGYWPKLYRVNLFCGNQLAACLVPLVIARGNTIDSNALFVVGDYTEATGLKGAAGKYLDTGISPFFGLAANDLHMAVYNRASAATGGNAVMGHSSGAAGMYMQVPWGGDGTAVIVSTNTSNPMSTPVLAAPYGLCISSRTAPNEHTFYQRGAAIATNTTNNTQGLAAGNLIVMARMADGSDVQHTAHTLAAYSVGKGLTAADVTAYTTHMQTFQTALGRAV